MTRASGFWDIVREDFETHGRDLDAPGFRALFAYRFGVWRLRLKAGVVRNACGLAYRLMHRAVRNGSGIEVHESARIGRRLKIAQGAVFIHERATVGDDCVLHQGVTISTFAETDAPPVLANRVDVGAGAAIFGPAHIGDDVRIGANAVVTVDLDQDSTALAPPARAIALPTH